MSSSSLLQQSLLAYYGREGLWGYVEVESGRGSSDLMRWWRAIAIGYQGRLGEAIRELSSLRHSQDVEMAAMVALVQFHHMQSTIDENEIDDIERALDDEERREITGRENGILLAAQFHLFVALREVESEARSDRLEKARRYCKMVCDIDFSSQRRRQPVQNLTGSQRRALILNAWIDMCVNGSTSEDFEFRQNAAFLLEQALSNRDVDWLLARAKSYAIGSTPEKLELALEHLNQAAALENGWIPAIMLKAKLLLALGDWEQSRDTASRLINEKDESKSSVEALEILALYELAHHPDEKSALNCLKNLAKCMERVEASNARLFFRIGSALGRIAGRSHHTLLEFIVDKFSSRAVSLDPHRAIYMAELGRQQRMLGQVNKAIDTYREAGDLDPSCEEVVLGQVFCQLDAGQIEDAESQLDFLSAIGDTMSTNVLPCLCLLRAMLSWRLKPRDVHGHISALNDADRAHFQSKPQVIADITQVLDSYARLDPDFIMDLARQYLEHLALIKSSFQMSSDDDYEDNEIIDSDSLTAVRRGCEILERIGLKIPGMLCARLLVVDAKLCTGDTDGAQRYLEATCGAEQCATAQLLLARIWLAKAQPMAAASAIERSIACDFRIRENPIFILVKAQLICRLDGNHTEAIDLLSTAIRKPGVREEEFGNTYIRVTDRASIFIALAKSQANCKCFEEAQSTLAEAHERFRDESIVITRLLLASAELAVAQNDLESALRLLDQVDTEESSFLDAQKLKAQLCLKYIRDKQQYTQVYQNLVNQNPQDFSHHERLGDALMRIQAPEAAVNAYESAHELAPRGAQKKTKLAAKVGKALLATHDYGRATDSYIQALQSNSGEIELRRDLANLFAKLRNPDAAIQVLTYTLSPAATVQHDQDEDNIIQLAASSSLDQLIADVQTLLLLADILLSTENASESPIDPMMTLQRALILQRIILDKVRQTHSSADVSEQRKFMASICKRCARLAKKRGDYEFALDNFQAALQHDAIDAPGQVELARFHLDIRRDIDACEQLCASALRVDTNYSPAMALAAELLSLRHDYAAATSKFRQLVINDPTDYKALAWLIDLLRRAGKLDDAPRLILISERQDPRAASHAGLNFCKGKLAQYQNDIVLAVNSYNLARKDAVFGVSALLALIEIYVNTDGDRFAAKAHDDEDDDDDDDDQGNEDSTYHQAYVSADALRVANALNNEISQFEHLIDPATTLRVKIVRAKLLLAKLEDKRNNCDQAMQMLIDILDEQKDYIPALLGMAQAFLIDGQHTKAKNALKRLTKLPFSHDFADDLEHGYLLLADMYVNKNKFDLAEDLCNRCLKFNLSCGRAWETMGHIREKEASYKDAAEMYEKAWLLEHETSAPIGFKLAFNYLKAKRFVEAIDICNKILLLYPDYPKIRHEILDSAINALRP